MTLGLDTAVGDGPQGPDGPEAPAGGASGELPPGWARATLGELGEWFGGGTPSKKRPEFWTDGTIPWLSPKDMGPDILAATQDLIHESALDASPVKLVPAGSVALVVRSGILERKVPVAYVPFDVTLNQDMKAVVPHHGIDGRWLSWAIRERERYILENCRKHGTTVASLEVPWLMSTEVLVPPYEEQLRIVAEVERQIAHISLGELAVDRARREITHLKSAVLERSLIEAASSGRLLKDLISEPLANGKSVPTCDGGFPVLKLNSIRGTLVDPSIQKGGDWEGIDPKKYLIAEGDFLVARGNGTLSLVGRGALVPEVRSPIAYPDTLIRVRVDMDKLSPVYLGLVWNSRSVREQIERQARTTAGIYKINQAILENIEIPYVPLRDQQLLVEEVSQAYAAFEPFADEVDKIRSSSSHLRAALLQAAFTGALVPQDPADEPASALLDRIRAEQKAKAPRKRAVRKPRSTPPGQEELPS
ncbi:restriction endonuclease subunit S [Streptomyces sp. XM83C]|uniref:restriction endonuclease subunit S n=1 Tax=Streptomyces sp. XM83C TaxID=2929781 RepID=UPI001FF80BC4|nr:restriction endonuclease subunit S [Streptomyces sp. XM83C]MCK1818892.1 restriction endonuclease subunit S [Streptomyces sp. XM83C]